MPKELNDWWTVVSFILAVFGMYVSYFKGRADLEKMNKERVLKEYEIEIAITRSKQNELKMIQHASDIELLKCEQDELKELIRMILKAQLNTMESLKAHGINGATSESITEIKNYLINH